MMNNSKLKYIRIIRVTDKIQREKSQKMFQDWKHHAGPRFYEKSLKNATQNGLKIFLQTMEKQKHLLESLV